MAPTKKLKEITSLENDVSMADMPADDVEVENPDPSILAFDEQRIRIVGSSTSRFQLPQLTGASSMVLRIVLRRLSLRTKTILLGMRFVT
jgi:hypothetical protein